MYIRKRYDKGAESPPRKNEYETVSNHPILKTDWALRAHIPRFLQTRPDRKQEFCDQRFYIDRGNEAQQEFPCNVSGESGVNSVKMFAFRLCKNGMETKQGSEIVERHSGKDLLFDKWALFGMKVCQCKGVFQIPERCFDTPAFVVKFTKQRRREPICGKVGDHGLVQTFFHRKSDHTERDWIQCIACVPNIVEMNLFGNPAVLMRLLTDTVCEAFGQRITEGCVKFRRTSQPKP